MHMVIDQKGYYLQVQGVSLSQLLYYWIQNKKKLLQVNSMDKWPSILLSIRLFTKQCGYIMHGNGWPVLCTTIYDCDQIKGQLEEFQSSHYISLILVKDKEKLVKAKEFFHDKTYYYIINAMI